MIEGGRVVQGPNVRGPLTDKLIANSQLLEKCVSMANQEFTGDQQCDRVTLDHETKIE